MYMNTNAKDTDEEAAPSKLYKGPQQKRKNKRKSLRAFVLRVCEPCA